MKLNIKNLFIKLSLLQKFCVAIILIFAFAGITISSLIISKQRNALKAEMNNNHIILMRNLARESIDALIFMDPLRLDEIVKALANTPGCIYAAIVDRNMRIVGHTTRKNLGRNLSELYPEIPSGLINIGETKERYKKPEGFRELIVPIKSGYETIGLFVAAFSTDNVDNAVEHNLRELKNYIVIVIASSMFISIWGAFWMAKLITTPLKKIKSSMELVQEGNLNAEIPNDNAVKCWEVFKCKLTDCPAYGKNRCWEISGTISLGGIHGSGLEKLHECKQCIVYQRACGDEIGELIEVFNRMIKELRESLKRLDDSNREKTRLEKMSALGEMAMTVAHEIKNPLNAIRGSVSYLKDNFKGKVLSEFLTIIEEETNRLNEIVITFMRFSKPTPLKLRLSDLRKCIDETLYLIRQEATEKNVEVTANIDQAISQFYFDPQQFKQALLNIMVNSIDATKAGDSIKITALLRGNNVEVAISDTGEGMSDEVAANIFKPFFSTKTRGTGLGLACVERIIKDHQGEITVSSVPGKGTEFIISIPCLKEIAP